MKKIKKFIDNFNYRTKIKPVERITMRMLTVTEEFDTDGNIHRCSKFVDYNPAKEHRNLKVRDFCIESLNAAGVQLNPCSLSLNNHEYVSQIKSQLNNINLNNE